MTSKSGFTFKFPCLIQCLNKYSYIIDGLDQTRMMYESSALARISAYVAKNNLIAALEAE